MGLIQEGDRRPRDWGYKVAFDRKDLPSLQDMARHIRETHNTDMIESFNARCEEKLNFSTEKIELDNGIEIQSVTKTEDLVVNVGLQHCINLILATNTNAWFYFGFVRSTGPSPPLVTNTALDNANGGPWYLQIGTYGWKEPKGMKLFFGTITPQGASDPNFSQSFINEMGVFSANLVLLNRENFYNLPPGRTLSADGTMYKQVFMFSCVIEFCPVA